MLDCLTKVSIPPGKSMCPCQTQQNYFKNTKIIVAKNEFQVGDRGNYREKRTIFELINTKNVAHTSTLCSLIHHPSLPSYLST